MRQRKMGFHGNARNCSFVSWQCPVRPLRGSARQTWLTSSWTSLCLSFCSAQVALIHFSLDTATNWRKAAASSLRFFGTGIHVLKDSEWPTMLYCNNFLSCMVHLVIAPRLPLVNCRHAFTNTYMRTHFEDLDLTARGFANVILNFIPDSMASQ